MTFKELLKVTPLSAGHFEVSYDRGTVLLSVFIALFACWLAFDLAERIHDKGNSRLASLAWWLGGACAMGTGIWAVPLAGTLALRLPPSIPMEMNPELTGLSLLIAIAASALALALFGRRSLRFAALGGGTLMGLSIALLQSVGIRAMEISFYAHPRPACLLLGTAVAIAGSMAAIAQAIQNMQAPAEHRLARKAASTLCMAGGLCGMHYLSLAGAVFTPAPLPLTLAYVINQRSLSLHVTLAALGMLGIAFIALLMKELANARNLRMARHEGMLEITSTILHNVGNVLNSINVSAASLQEQLSHSELSGLTDLDRLLATHEKDLVRFLSEDPAGKELPAYIHLLADYWQKQQPALLQELASLTHHLRHIRDIIHTQQSISTVAGIEETVSIPDLIEEAITLSNIQFGKFSLQITREYEPIQPLLADKVRLLQVLVNLLQNAKHALTLSSREDKSLLIKVTLKDRETFRIAITDNGTGIEKPVLSRLFSYGFTGWSGGHGYGLYACKKALTSMQGTLTAASDGRDQGATFTLELPYRPQLSPGSQTPQRKEIHHDR